MGKQETPNPRKAGPESWGLTSPISLKVDLTMHNGQRLWRKVHVALTSSGDAALLWEAMDTGPGEHSTWPESKEPLRECPSLPTHPGELVTGDATM